MLTFLREYVLGIQVRYLRQYHLTPKAVGELIPVSASDNNSFLVVLLVLPTTKDIRGVLRIILPCAMPLQEGYFDGTRRSDESAHLLQVDAIHPGGEIALPPLEVHHVGRLRWIQKDVRV